MISRSIPGSNSASSSVKVKTSFTGDHLLVDRFTYHFRRPQRGEIIVFKTRGIPGLEPGQLYIKRLVAFGNEHVRIGDDRHLVIDGKRLDASTRHFESVYSIPGPPRESKYSGHLNQDVARRYMNPAPSLAPLFPTERQVFVVPEDQYLAMGDNTVNSRDSRAWGGLPRTNVIGKCWFVYWPMTDRFGWGYR
jgi:signal peptidase I